MNRTEELRMLQAEATPPELETTVERALKRKRVSRRKVRMFGIPAGSLAACFGAFILLVNLSVPFARACGGVPVLRELAKAVAWSPSLSAAVEDEFVQPIGQEQTENGITARVEYLIVDQKQLNVFYTLHTKEYGLLDAESEVALPDGSEGFSMGTGSFGTPNGELRQATLDFMDREMPERLAFTLKIYENSYYSAADAEQMPPAEQTTEDIYFDNSFSKDPPYLAELTFNLEFDPWFTAQGEIVEVKQPFQIDGQTLTLETAEIYPTHLRLDVGYDPDNTAWLTGLEFYVENETGQRFDPVTNGITAAGGGDSLSTVTFWMDTTYFSDSKALTLYITQARWLEKDRARIRLNLATGDHDPLPDGAELMEIQNLDQGYLLTFAEKRYRDNHMYSLWQTAYDEAGTECPILFTGSSHTYENTETGQQLDGSETGVFYETFPLSGYTQETVHLQPVFTKVTNFSQPVTVPIK